MNTQTHTNSIICGIGYSIPHQSVIDLIGKDEQTTHAFAYSHQVCTSGGSFLHFGALCKTRRYAATIEQKEYATAEYERMKADKLARLGNKLVFVGMGMDYTARYEDDVCNHRIRTEIVNPNGRHFFIEVGGSSNGEMMHFDHVIDEDQRTEYENKQEHYRNKIMEMGGFMKVSDSHPAMIKYREYQQQPYHWYKKDEWFNSQIKYTKSNLIKVVNDLFECNFSEVEIHSYLITTEDYKSISPKF